MLLDEYQDTGHAQRVLLRSLFGNVATPERAIPVTAVSASGPAYVFWFIEQLAASAVKLGIPKDDALKLASHTVFGAAKLLIEKGESPEELRKQVTSKGGTTEAALKVFDEEKLAERFMRAVEAASRRGTELGKLSGKD